MLWRQGRTPAENEGGTGSPLGLVVTWVPPGWHVISWLCRSMRRIRANRSRTSWRSNTSGFSTAAPRRTGRSSSPPRQRLRPHGFLLRPSTAGVLRPAFVALRLPWGYGCLHQLQAAAAPRASPSSRVLKSGATKCRAFAPLPVTLPMAAAPHPTSPQPASQATTAGLMPRNLTRACSGLAALAADAGG